MRFYAIVRGSKLPVVFGNLFDDEPWQAWTAGFIIFFPTKLIELRVLVHEIDHVKHWWLFFLGSLALWALFRPALPWLLLAPFAYLIVYSVAGFRAMASGGDWYEDNWFERHARRAAGEEK